MRPERLVIQNFGPFHGEPTTIEFGRLDRLFLVAGETGAGKTTIFDAMCFALYGQALGTRESTSLRAQRAADDEPTVVELVFRLRDRRFKVQRSPEYVRKKQRGTGTTRAEPTVTFYRDVDGTFEPIVGKPSVINGRIAQEIGLSYAEFSRILVLPQGEFQHFLEMNSEQRAKILHRLFPVDRHAAITARAREAASAVESELARRAAELDAIVARGFDPARIDETRAALTEAARLAELAFGVADEAFVGAARARAQSVDLAKRFAELDEARAKHDRAESERESVDARRRAVDRSRAAARVLERVVRRDDAARLLEESQRARAESDVARSAFAARHEALAPAIASLPTRRSELEVARKESSHRRSAVEELRAIAALRAELASLATSRIEASATRDESRRAVAAREAEVAALDRLRGELDERTSVHARLATRRGVLASVAGIASFLAGAPELSRTIADAIAADELALVDATERLESALAAVADVDRAIDRDRAASIAAGLATGEPCPVCGSEEHPRPASHGESLANLQRARVDAEARVEDARRLVAQVMRTKAMGEGRLSDHRARIAADSARLADAGFETPEAHRDETAAVATEFASIDAEIVALRASVAALPELRRSLDASRRALADLDERVRATSESEAALAGRLSSHEARIGTLAEVDARLLALPSESDAIEAFDRRARALEVEIERVARESERLEQERTRLDHERVAVESRIAEREREREATATALAAALVAESFADEASARSSARSEAIDAEDERVVAAHDQERIRITATLDRLGPELDGVARPDSVALERLELEARAARDRANAERESARRALDDFERQSAGYLASRAAKEAYESENRALVQLARDLMGDNPQKLDFPKYALERFLSAVLAQASMRFLRLTRERYSFELDSTVDDKRSKAGLDIDVHDAHTGLRRDVKTLSGGEKFMAALSLALGLSDVIEARAGGIALDALFVDEGFGSLDSEALDRALSVLDEVGASRIVGVISHVDAMRTAIPSQLRVTRTGEGSRVDLV